MYQIENGVACPEALDSMHELSATTIINIKEKLDLRMQQEISKLITVNTDPTQKRKDIVLKYLKEEKKATQLRISNYSKGKQQQDETHSNFTSSRGRGRGRGRGGSNRGRDNSNKQYKNNPRASAKSSSCLLCGESHYLHAVGGSSMPVPVDEFLKTCCVIYYSLHWVFGYIAFITANFYGFTG